MNDLLGRPTTTVLADNRLLGTTYDPDSNVVGITLPSNAVHAFSYTPVDLLASYTPPSVNLDPTTTSYSYDTDQELVSVARPDGVTVTSTYVRPARTPFSTRLAARRKLACVTDVTEDGNFYSHYGYDADDNRTTFTNQSGTVNPTYDAQDRLLTYGSNAYQYTADGELTTKTASAGMTQYAYDAFGNLLAVSLPGGEDITYIADGENRRVGKEVGGTLTTGFLYKDALNVVVQLDGSGNVVSRFVFGSKPDVPDYYTTSAGTFRILSDHLGSPRLIVNASTGATVEEIDYDEFGNVTNDTAPGTIPFGFAGGLYDGDTGLVRFGARDYDASVGRWTSKDPIRFAGRQIKLYVYAGNDPVNRRDPDGEGPITATAVGLACQAYAIYQDAQSLSQLNALENQIKSLTNALKNINNPPDVCDPEAEAQAAEEAAEIQDQILNLERQYTAQQLSSIATAGLQEAACAAAVAAAFLAPTP